jgi:hypothetical protein
MIQSKTYGLQNETRQYLRRLYAYGRELAPADVADIDNLVKGLKQLNLWSYLVEGWMFSAMQNIGSSSTTLSFLRNENRGTLINSPTWGVEGIQVTANNQRIDLNSTPITFGFPFCIIAIYRMHTNTSINSDSFVFYGFPNNQNQSGVYEFSNSSGGGRDLNIKGYGGFMIGANSGNYSIYKNRNEFQVVGQSFEQLTPNGGLGQTAINNNLFNSNTTTGSTNSFSRTTDLYIPSSPARLFYGHGNATVNNRTLNSIFLFRSGLKFSQMSNIRILLLNTILKKQTVIL